MVIRNPFGARWYNDPKLGQHGFTRVGSGQGMCYSCPNMPHYGRFTQVSTSGDSHSIEFEGRGWLDNQICDLKKPVSAKWERAAFQFIDGDRVNMYSFLANDLHLCTWFKPDGSQETYEGFIQRQTDYTKLPNGLWISRGWEFDIPIKAKKYKVVLFQPNLMPSIAQRGGSMDTIGTLYDAKGQHVGWALIELMGFYEPVNY